MACAQTAVAAAGREVLGFGLVLGLLLLAASSKAVLYDTLDPDAFWHLRVAEQLTRDGVRPLIDQMSFASIRQPWTPYSWLAELSMKRIWDVAGPRGAVIAHALCTGAFLTLVASCCLIARRGVGTCDDHGTAHEPPAATLLPILLATMSAALLALPYLSFRPVTFALVVLAAITWLLIRDRAMDERSRAVWVVPPLTALATNLHIFAVLAPLWMTALLIGAAWEARHSKPDEDSRRRVRRYALLWAATWVGWAMTPLLPGTIATIIHYAWFDPMVAGPVISEMQPFYRGWLGMSVLAIVIGCIAWNRKQLRAGEMLWLIGMLALLMRHGRLAPAFVLVAMPLFARAMPRLSDRALGRPIVSYAAAILLCVGIVRVVNALPPRDQPTADWLNRHGPDTPGYPCDAAEFVAQRVTPRSHRIINEFTWGGYLAWRLGPQGYRVLLDGRTQVYSPDFWRRAYLRDIAATRELLCTTNADAAVLPIKGSRFRECLIGMGWQTAYRDDRAEVLVPAAPWVKAN